MGVLGSRGQTEPSSDPEGLLAFGQTYYWRVAEVNAPPDSTVFPGPVWTFTVEPYSYPITGITATASSQSKADVGPQKTVEGSGLDPATDEHSTAADHGWLSDKGPA